MCVCCVGGSTIVSRSSCFLMYVIFFNIPFTFHLPFFFNFLIFFSLKILRNAKFPKIYDGLWKPNKKNSTQTIFLGVVHDQPWSVIVWFACGVHYCAQLLPEFFFERFLLSFSFANVFSFNFLVSFIWNSQKCIFSKIYDALLKSN